MLVVIKIFQIEKFLRDVVFSSISSLKAQWSENVLLLQNGQLCSRIMTVLAFFPLPNIFLQKMWVLLLPEVEKLQPWNNSNLYPCDVRWVIAVWNYWPRILYFQVSTLEGPIFMITHALIQIYVRNISIEGWMKNYYPPNYPSYVISPSHKIFVKVILWMAVVQYLLQIWMPKLVYSLYLTLDNIKNVFFQFS